MVRYSSRGQLRRVVALLAAVALVAGACSSGGASATPAATTATAMRQLASYVRYAGYWFTVADVRTVTDDLLERARERLYDTFGPWET